ATPVLRRRAHCAVKPQRVARTAASGYKDWPRGTPRPNIGPERSTPASLRTPRDQGAERLVPTTWRLAVNTEGQHLLIELHGCDPVVLDDVARIERLMRAAAERARANVVTSVFHPFVPQGVTGVVVIEESHLSIHTWPEHGYAA